MIGFWSVIGQNGVVFEALLIEHVPSCLYTLYNKLRPNITNFCQETWSLGVSLAKELTFEPMIGFWSVVSQNGVVFEALLIWHVSSCQFTLYNVLWRNITNFCQEALSLRVSLAQELIFETNDWILKCNRSIWGSFWSLFDWACSQLSIYILQRITM